MVAISSIIILSLVPFLFWDTSLASPYMNILTSITSLMSFSFFIYASWWSLKNNKNIFKPLLLFTIGMGLYFISNIFYFIFEQMVMSINSLWIADSSFFICYPFLMLGMLLLHKRPFNIRVKELLDVVIITASSFFIIWFPFIWPVIEPTHPDTLSMILSLLYLFLDLILLAVLLTLLFNKNRKIHELPIILLSIGLFFQVVGDMVYAYYQVTPVLIYKWLFSVLFATNSIYAILAVTSILNKVNLDLREIVRSYHRRNPHNHDWISYLPLFLVLWAYSLLIITIPDAALIWGVGVIIVLVLLRQIILLNETKKAQLEQEKAEKLVKNSLKEKESLLREIHHRVKNNLQVILSLLSLQSQNLVDEKDREVFMESQNQVRSMALIHEKLYESDNLSSINFSDYLKTLLNSLIYNYHFRSSQIDLKIDVEEIELNIETSVPCGLIVNELVSNSLKHSFMPGTKGKIIIKMHKDNDQYILIIADDGVGPIKESGMENNTTLGLNLVDTLVNQLDGSLEILREKGTVYRIIFKELEYKPRI